MKKILAFLIAFVLAFAAATAQDTVSVSRENVARTPESLWSSAADSYSMGDFDSAIKSYEDLYKLGASSSSLFYNLGNAYYRKGQIGRAILNYERALKADPSDSDARHNLEMAKNRTLDKIDSVPQFVLFSWVNNLAHSLSSNTWAVVSLVLLSVGLALMLLYYFSRSTVSRKVFFIAAMVSFLFALFCFLFSYSLAKSAESSDYAVVVENIGSVKSAPAAGGNSIFVLHEGTKVRIMESVQGWCKVEISDGRQGWIKSSDIEII